MARRKNSAPQAVAAAQEAAQPKAYASRYQFSMDGGGMVQPRNANAALPDVFKTVQFRRSDTDQLEAYVPALASGYMNLMPGMFTGDWSVESFANWEQALLPNDGKIDIRKAIKWWRRDPLVYRCLQVLTQLSNAKPTFSCEDEDFRKLVENWAEKAAGHTFRSQWFFEFFRSSMVPVIKTLIPYKPRDYKDEKAPQSDGNYVKSNAQEEKTEAIVKRNEEAFAEFQAAFTKYEQATAMHAQGLCSAERLKKLLAIAASVQYKWLKGNIAGAYTILNPLDVDIDGPMEMQWLRQPYLRLSGQLITAISCPTDQQKEALSKLPIDIVRQVKEGAMRIWLSPNIATVIFGQKQPYERYPTPMVLHCEEALDMKYMMYAMDKAVAKSVRDKILKITIGNDMYPAFDDGQLQKLSQVFNNPSRNMTIFWNHTLSIEWVEPQNALLADSKKYDHWNDEIRTAFGIAKVLTGTADGGGAVGDGILNLKGLEEEVEEAQDAYKEWFTNEINLLRQALGVKHEVEVGFDRMNLKDEEKFMALLLQLYQQGLIDPQTAIETMRFNFPTVVKRMENAIKLRKKGLFVPIPSANNMGPDGTVLPKGGGIKGGPAGGKPKLQPKTANQQKRGTSQPKKATAKLIQAEDGIAAYFVVQADEMDQEERAIAAETFGIPTEWVVTEAEYEQATGKSMNWLPPLPQLTPAAAMGVMRNIQKAQVKIDADVVTEIEAIKATGSGKRGKYVTDKLKEETFERVMASFTSKLKPEGVTAEEWANRRSILVESLQADPGHDPADNLPLIAACTLHAQYALRG